MDEMNVKAVETTENKETRPKIIAVDFDGCLATNKFPEVGDPINKTISRLKQEQANGAKVILWTNRRGKPLDDAVNFCKEQGIHLDAVNANLPEIIEAFDGDTRKVFANEYWDDRAVYMAEEEDDWAAREIALACQSEREASEGTDDWDYGVACYESALRAYRSLMQDGHSGFSIQITKSILNRLIDGKCLTPIEDTEDIWNEVTGEMDVKDGRREFQCKRMSSLFKTIASDGTTTYSDVGRVCGVNANSPDVAFTNGLMTRLIDKLFPITMPYPDLRRNVGRVRMYPHVTISRWRRSDICHCRNKGLRFRWTGRFRLTTFYNHLTAVTPICGQAFPNLKTIIRRR